MNFRTLSILAVNLIAASAFAQTTAIPAAQGSAAAVDTASTSDASNQGVALNAGGNTSNSKQISVLFPPPVQTGISTESNCILHGASSYSVGWSFVSWSTPTHEFSKECALQKTVDRYAALCQYNTVKRLLDQFVKEAYKIDPANAYKPIGDAPAVYEDYVNLHFKDLTYKECADSKNPPVTTPTPAKVVEVEKRVEVPGATVVKEVKTPAKETTKITKTVNLASDVFFATGKHVLTGTGRNALADAMSKFDKTTDSVSSVEGHTDNRGGDKYNLNLSMRRANAVASELKGLGFTVGSVKGLGYHKPADTNATAEGRTRNRRVTLQISTQESVEVVNVK